MVVMILATTCWVKVSGGQMFPLPQPPTGQGRQGQGVPRSRMPDEENPLDPNREEKQAKLRNDDRQKRLVADTDKILALVTDLKAQVDKSSKDAPSADLIKKTDEIEKLAHSVKERMKG